VLRFYNLATIFIKADNTYGFHVYLKSDHCARKHKIKTF